jgi:hypothetical protein
MNRYFFLFLFGFSAFSPQASLIQISASGYVSYHEDEFQPFMSLGDLATVDLVINTNSLYESSQFELGRAFHYFDEFYYTVTFGRLTVNGEGGRAEVSNDYTDSLGRTLDRLIFENGGVGISSSEGLSSMYDVENLSAGTHFSDFINYDALISSDFPETINLANFDERKTASIQFNINNGDFDWIASFAELTSVSIIKVSTPPLTLLLSTGLLLFCIRRIFHYR